MIILQKPSCKNVRTLKPQRSRFCEVRDQPNTDQPTFYVNKPSHLLPHTSHPPTQLHTPAPDFCISMVFTVLSVLLVMTPKRMTVKKWLESEESEPGYQLLLKEEILESGSCCTARVFECQ